MQKPLPFVATLLAFGLATSAFALNPVVQTIYTADPAPLVHGDTVYLYTGHDEDGSTWFTMKDWRVFSSKDTVNWTDHGSPLSLQNFSWAKDSAWAGHAIERDGKFYWYVPVQQMNGAMVIGVAVGDSPIGPFKDALGKPLIVDGFGDIDPAAFIDKNGQAYLVWGNPTYKYVRLNKDMISYDTSIGDKGVFRGPMSVEAFGKRTTTDRPSAYEEAPWIYERHGIYYNFYAGGPVPEHLAYSTAPSPEGPWRYGGILMPTQGRSFTNHPGVIDFKGKTYLFYHDGSLPGGGGFTRSVCVDEIKFNPDGSINAFNMTREGPPPVATLDPYVRQEAETIAWTGGVETEPSSEGGMAVHDIDDGDYILVKNVDFGPEGAGAFAGSVLCSDKPKSAYASSIELRLGKADGPLIGTLPVSYTAGQWKREVTNVTGAQGIQDLCFVFRGPATGDLFKFDHWQFARKTSPTKLVGLDASLDRYKIDTRGDDTRARLTIRAIYSDGTSRDVTDRAKIDIAPSGLIKADARGVTGLQFGEAAITASHEGFADNARVIVKDIKTEFTVRSLSANHPSIEMISGDQKPFAVTAEYADGHSETVTPRVTVVSTTPAVATATQGLITAQSRGSATLQISYADATGPAAKTEIKVAVANRNPFAQNLAASFNEDRGAVIENSSENGKNVCDLSDGEWIKFNSLDFGAGAKSIEVRVASATQGGKLLLALDRPDGPIIATFDVGNTGGWQNWTTLTAPVSGATGMHDLYLRVSGTGGILFNINWWRFRP